MMGTFGGALEARQIDASNGRLTADVTGEVESEEGVLVISRIHVAMRLVAPEEARAIAVFGLLTCKEVNRIRYERLEGKTVRFDEHTPHKYRSSSPRRWIV